MPPGDSTRLHSLQSATGNLPHQSPRAKPRTVSICSALVLVDFGELGIDDAIIGSRRRLARGRSLRCLLLLIDRLTHLHGDRRQILGLVGHRLNIGALDCGLGLGNRCFDLGLQRFVDLVTIVGQLTLGRVD